MGHLGELFHGFATELTGCLVEGAPVYSHRRR